LGRAVHPGLLSLLGLIAIAAPFAAPFIRAAWSKYLILGTIPREHGGNGLADIGHLAEREGVW
jgi:hypothetical protein